MLSTVAVASALRMNAVRQLVVWVFAVLQLCMLASTGNAVEVCSAASSSGPGSCSGSSTRKPAPAPEIRQSPTPVAPGPGSVRPSPAPAGAGTGSPAPIGPAPGSYAQDRQLVLNQRIAGLELFLQAGFRLLDHATREYEREQVAAQARADDQVRRELEQRARERASAGAIVDKTREEGRAREGAAWASLERLQSSGRPQPQIDDLGPVSLRECPRAEQTRSRQEIAACYSRLFAAHTKNVRDSLIKERDMASIGPSSGPGSAGYGQNAAFANWADEEKRKAEFALCVGQGILRVGAQYNPLVRDCANRWNVYNNAVR